MFTEGKESRWLIHNVLTLLLTAVGLGAPAAVALSQHPPEPTAPIANPKAAAPLPIPCCIITAINKVPADMVTAQVTATGQTFQFKVNDSALVKSLRVGEAVWANFKTGQVSVDGRTICGTIVSMGGTQMRSTSSAGATTGTLPSSGAPAPQPATRAATPAPSKAASLAAGAGSAPAPACCGITVIHVSTRLVDAQVNTSPTTGFTFSVPDSIAIQNLTVGQPVWANFKTMQVSLNGQTACCRIVSGSPQQASKPGLMAPATGAAPGVGAAGSSSAGSAPASAGQPKTEAAAVAAGASPGLMSATAAATLSLHASLPLCVIVDCPVSPPPVITEVNPASVLKPGGAVLLRGVNFMDANGRFGQAVLVLYSIAQGASIKYPLENAQWGDTAAYGTIPTSITGVMDQRPSFEILRSDGLTSAPFTPPPVPPGFGMFRATRSETYLPVSGVRVGCSQAADQNQCNGWADYSPPESIPPPPLTYFGVHRAFLVQESGRDYVDCYLRYGWVPESYQTEGSCLSSPPIGPIVSFRVDWKADSTSPATCLYTLFIIGPIGVPVQ